MTNKEIIENVAVNIGMYTVEEIEDIKKSGEEIPLHTLNGWLNRAEREGIQIELKDGEEGIETKLWKKSLNHENGFYLAKSFLYKEEQLEIFREDGCEIDEIN